MRPHLIFDLDGTISDPATGIARCINYALSSFGYAPLPQHGVSRYIVNALHRLVAGAIPLGVCTSKRADFAE